VTLISAAKLLTIATVGAFALAGETYYPAPESSDGWRRCRNDDEVRNNAGMDPQRLNLIGQAQLQLYNEPWAIVIVRNGYVAREWFGVPAMPGTTFDVWSCTKSATGMAFGMLFEDSRNHLLPGGQQIDLESTAYDFIPEGQPLSDSRKKQIKLKHLLSMTSGIPGESHGLLGMAVVPGSGEFELALGKESSRFGASAATLMAAPGESWDYSDQGFAHLALIFSKVSGKEISDYMNERVFRPIGIRNVSWDVEGGSGHIGPHTNAHSGLHLSARDFARVGYLMAHRGKWEGKQIVPEWWIDVATRSSQELNRSYGYTFWVNTDGRQWPSGPRDAFAFKGYAANRCYIVPSMDLVVVRMGYTPPNWAEDSLLPAVLEAVRDPSKSILPAKASRDQAIARAGPEPR
jgi:CubicO group peptidase (beta-lactamase class C family)